MKPFNDISSVVTELQNAMACADRVFTLIEAPTESADPKLDLLKRMAKLIFKMSSSHIYLTKS